MMMPRSLKTKCWLVGCELKKKKKKKRRTKVKRDLSSKKKKKKKKRDRVAGGWVKRDPQTPKQTK